MEKELDTILATMQVTKSNVKGRHWMVTGHEYEALHKMFYKIYKVLDDGTDKVGEIFRQLRMIPPFSMGLCISESKVEDEKLIMPTWDMVAKTRDEIDIIIALVHEGCYADKFAPTTENDLLNITSQLRFWVMHLNSLLGDMKGSSSI